MLRRLLIAIGIGLAGASPALADESPSLLQHELRRLHADEIVDLCAQHAGKALLIVNTASFCGFTPQFDGLEQLFQRYRERGLAVLGFPSNDFRQEADDEARTAEVCRLNYGVSFDMFAPISVRGSDAHPIFRELAAQAEAPRWNFHKYVVGRDGRVVASFSSRVAPGDAALEAAIESALQ